MRILISTENGIGAHYYERTSIARASAVCNFETKLWNLQAESAFDVFDKFVPDLFITQSYNINPSIIQCIQENPDVQIYAKTGDWGPLPDTYDIKKYQILVADDNQKENLKKLVKASNKPVYVGAHYLESRAEDTHSGYRTIGCYPLHMRLAACVFQFAGSREIDEFKSDISFCGSYWPYKGINFQKYLFQFLRPECNYNFKVFGNGGWGIPQFCGAAEDENLKHIFRSSKINLNVSEIHAQAYGVEHCERIYKVLLSKGLLISDYNKDIAENIFNNGEIVWCQNPEEMKNNVDYYLSNLDKRESFIQNGYNKVIQSETYFHRLNFLLSSLGFDLQAKRVLESYEKVKLELKL